MVTSENGCDEPRSGLASSKVLRLLLCETVMIVLSLLLLLLLLRVGPNALQDLGFTTNVVVSDMVWWQWGLAGILLVGINGSVYRLVVWGGSDRKQQYQAIRIATALIVDPIVTTLCVQGIIVIVDAILFGGFGPGV